jgi:hypothetical protein
MKKKLFTYCLFVFALAAMISCKKDERYAPKTLSAGQIQFQVTDPVLTGTVLVGVVQPSMDVVAAKFSKNTPTIVVNGKVVANPNYVGGNIVITANLSSNLTNLTINILTTVNVTTSGVTTTVIQRETKASFTGISGSQTWTQSIAALTFNGVPVTTSAGGTTYNLEFVGSNADGTVVTTRLFQAALAN